MWTVQINESDGSQSHTLESLKMINWKLWGIKIKMGQTDDPQPSREVKDGCCWCCLATDSCMGQGPFPLFLAVFLLHFLLLIILFLVFTDPALQPDVARHTHMWASIWCQQMRHQPFWQTEVFKSPWQKFKAGLHPQWQRRERPA